MNKTAASILLGLYLGHSQATCPSWPTAERFTLNDDEVADKRTGLVWKRCSVGQILSANTCTGAASSFTHEAALQYANSQSGWRLPNVKELFSLADKGCQNPSVDSMALPSTVSGSYWSSSPSGGVAWNVHFALGGVNEFSPTSRGYSYFVRLVRTTR